MTDTIENRIDSLSPEGKKLLLLKVKETLEVQSKNTTSSDRKRIVAYVQGSEDFSLQTLKATLQKKLPDYMVPSQFVPVVSMPLLPNGKIDRKQLHKATVIKSIQPTKEKKSTTDVTSKVAQKLIAIWEETLGFAPIHKDDNFFEIGGDSILSIQIIAKARKKVSFYNQMMFLNIKQ